MEPLPLSEVVDELLARTQKTMRASMRRLAAYIERRPFTPEGELQTMLERILLRVLLPILRKRYAEYGRAIQQQLAAWRASVQMAQSETDLAAEIGYWHSRYMMQVLQQVAARAAPYVAREILRGIARGDDRATTMQAISQYLQGLAEYQLERIVRTETTRYYNYAVVYETAAYPEVAGYRYDVVQDDRTSETCRALIGKVVRRDQLQYVPPLHPNCRTQLVPLLAEDMRAARHVEPQDYERVAPTFGGLPAFLKERLALGASVSPVAEFWELWNAHEDSVRKLCFSLVGGDQARGEDLCSETLMRAYERYYQYDPSRSTFAGWIYRIARSILINDASRQRHEVHVAQFERAEWQD